MAKRSVKIMTCERQNVLSVYEYRDDSRVFLAGNMKGVYCDQLQSNSNVQQNKFLSEILEIHGR